MSSNGLNGSSYELPRDTDPAPADPIEQVRNDVQVLRADVSSLRGEVQNGFAELTAKDKAHDEQLTKLAGRVTIPLALLYLLVQALPYIPQALGIVLGK